MFKFFLFSPKKKFRFRCRSFFSSCWAKWSWSADRKIERSVRPWVDRKLRRKKSFWFLATCRYLALHRVGSRCRRWRRRRRAAGGRRERERREESIQFWWERKQRRGNDVRGLRATSDKKRIRWNFVRTEQFVLVRFRTSIQLVRRKSGSFKWNEPLP